MVSEYYTNNHILANAHTVFPPIPANFWTGEKICG